MEANTNTLVAMGIISDKVYNDTPNVDYFEYRNRGQG